MLSRLDRLRRRGGELTIPFKSDLVQHLFKDNDFLMSDNLYARDYSGLNNHALMKNSYMLKSTGIEALPLPADIILSSTDNWSISFYFGFQSDVVTTDNFGLLGNLTGSPYTSRIRIRQGSGIYIRDNSSTELLFTQVKDFTTIKKYTFNYHDGKCDYYINDVFQEQKNWVITGYSARQFVGAAGFNSIKGQYFNIKITNNTTNSIVAWFPCATGGRHIFDIVSGNYFYTTTASYAYQSIYHHNIKYGADCWTNYSEKLTYVPHKVDGTSIDMSGLESGDYRWAAKLIDKTNPFPVCETTIQTVEGDYTWWNIKNAKNDKLFDNVKTEDTIKDVLIYNTAKTSSEIAAINKYTKQSELTQYVYNSSVLRAIGDKIRTGTVESVVIGDSISPFWCRVNALCHGLCNLKGVGFGSVSTGNYQLNILGDITVATSGTYSYLDGESTKDKFGINGYTTFANPGSSFSLQPRWHLWTNLKIYFAKNTGYGSFDVVVNGETYPVNCNGAQSLGVFSLDLAENKYIPVIQNVVGTVYLYGFEFNNIGGAQCHILSNGGFTSGTFTQGNSYMADYCALKTNLDYAVILLGANDGTVPNSKATFKANISTIIGYARSGNPNLKIILLTPTTRGLVAGQPGENLAYWDYARQYAEALIELSSELSNVAVIDFGMMFPRYDAALALGYMDGVVHHTIAAQKWYSKMMLKTISNA